METSRIMINIVGASILHCYFVSNTTIPENTVLRPEEKPQPSNSLLLLQLKTFGVNLS